MRTTLDIDEALMADALALAPRGMTKAALIEAALRAWLAERAADHLIELGGTMPEVEPARRRRS